MRSVYVRIQSRELVVEGVADKALRGQVVALLGLHLRHHLVEARIAFE